MYLLISRKVHHSKTNTTTYLKYLERNCILLQQGLNSLEEPFLLRPGQWRQEGADVLGHQRPEGALVAGHQRPKGGEVAGYQRCEGKEVHRYQRPEAAEVPRHQRPEAAEVPRHQRPEGALVPRIDCCYHSITVTSIIHV